MTTLSKYLLLLLLVQIGVSGVFFWSNSQDSSLYTAEPLLGVAMSEVDEIIITQGGDDAESVTLRKLGDLWQLPELGNLPVLQQKMQQIIDQLEALTVTWPVAKSNSSQQRFEVSDSEFLRKIQFFKGDDLVQSLYLGSSPGLRKTHVRREGESEIFTVELNAFDFPANSKNWVDRQFLAVADIDRLETDEVKLVNKQDKWFFDSGNFISAPVEVNQNAVSELVAQLASLSVNDVLDNLSDLSSTSALSLNAQSGSENWRYEFFRLNDQYLVRRNDSDVVFSIGSQLYSQLEKFTRENLTVAQPLEPTTPAPTPIPVNPSPGPVPASPQPLPLSAQPPTASPPAAPLSLSPNGAASNNDATSP